MSNQKVVGPQGIVDVNNFSNRQGIEDYDLPSRGLAYTDDKGNLLFPDGKIQISPMTVAEEKMLASNAAGDGSKKLASLIDRTCDLKGMLAKELLIQDVHALIYAIRSASYGNVYPFDYECPECKHKAQHALNLDEHPVSYAPDGFSDIVEIDLPISKSKVIMRRFRLKDENSKSSDSGAAMFEMLARAITQIDDQKIMHWQVADGWLNNLLVRDRAAITKALGGDEEEFGISGTTTVTCANCGHVQEGVGVPFGADFFRAD